MLPERRDRCLGQLVRVPKPLLREVDDLCCDGIPSQLISCRHAQRFTNTLEGDGHRADHLRVLNGALCRRVIVMTVPLR